MLRNLGLKVVALVFAFLLWFQIGAQQSIQRTITIPVEFINVPTNLEIASDYSRYVDVVIRAEQSTIPVDERQMAVVLNLQTAKAGENVIPLSESNIKDKPFGIQIISMTPARINLRLDRTTQKIVQIEPVVQGQPAAGYEVTQVASMPQQVLIAGPESRVDRVKSVATEPVDIEGQTKSVSQEVYLNLSDPRLRIERSSAMIVVTIEEQRRKVELIHVPVKVVPENSQVRLSRRSVTVEGTLPVSYKVDPKSTELAAVIDVAGLPADAGWQELAPDIVFPEQYKGVFRVSSVLPPEIKVRKVK